MDILIIEDEPLAAERLKILVKNFDKSLQIAGCLESIEESVQWLQTKKHPDLILLDIHLSDGHSFEIFKKVQVMKPVIFTTAYDNYALSAFQLFSIDYILKPVTAEALAIAIRKYQDLSRFNTFNYAELTDVVKDELKTGYKSRFLAKVGQRSFFIQEEDVSYIVSENKIVYIVDKSGNRFVISFTLEKLEPLLNPRNFFRINRKTIAYFKAIDQIKPYFTNRLKLFLKNNKQTEDLIVSRERVKDFKDWAEL